MRVSHTRDGKRERERERERARDDDDEEEEAGSGGGARVLGTRVEVPRARPASHPPRAVPPSVQGLLRSPPRQAPESLSREKKEDRGQGGSCSGLGPSGAPLSLPSAMAPPTTFVVPVVALHSASRCLRCGALTINQLAFPLGGSIDRSLCFLFFSRRRQRLVLIFLHIFFFGRQCRNPILGPTRQEYVRAISLGKFPCANISAQHFCATFRKKTREAKLGRSAMEVP